MATPITTVFFDIGNVLVGFDHHRMWQQLATVSPYSADEIYHQIQPHQFLHRHGIGDITSEDLYFQLQSLLQLDPGVSFEQFCQLWGEIFWPQDAMMALADALRQSYCVMLLSNTNEIHWIYLTRAFPLFNHLDDAILSFQVKALKPAPEIYTEALRRANARPEQSVFIDDLAVNIQAACALGIQGIRYQSDAQIHQALRELDLRW